MSKTAKRFSWLKIGRKANSPLETLRSTILFDPIWYRRAHPEIGSAAIDAASHYLRYGVSEKLAPSLYFDGPWYVENNEDVARAGINPLLHYLDHGYREGRNPHPLFDTRWYEEKVSSTQLKQADPLTHYLMEGWRAGISPHPLFDTELYRRLYPETIGANPLLCFLLSDYHDLQRTHLLFDPIWYLKQNEDVAKAELLPLVHYLRYGWRENRQPHPLFDTAWYLQKNPDVAKAGINPLIHFLRYGWLEERNPHPLFDMKWYVNSFRDAKPEQPNPLMHYCGVGWIEGRSPHPLFDGRRYLTNNPDVERERVNPLVHYVQSGWREGRIPHPLFDPTWYLSHYPDVVSDGVEPLGHYLNFGWVENRNPGPFFDTFWYRSKYHGEGELDDCPLYEYVSNPAFGDRVPHPLFDPTWYQVSYSAETNILNPLLDYVCCGIELGRLPSPDFPRVVASLPIRATSPRVAAGTAFEQALSRHTAHTLVTKVESERRKAIDVCYEVWRAPASLEGRIVCLFAAHAPDGHIPNSTLHYMQALSREGVAVVLIVASRNAGRPHELQVIDNATAGLIARENIGYDFASWALGTHVLSGVWKASTVIFANDSVFGPLTQLSLTNLLRRIEISEADYLGLTQSWQVKHHYQSYFFALKARALSHPGIRYLWATLQCAESREEAIERYEVTMLETVESLGLQTEALFPLNDRDRGEDMNPVLDHWQDLVGEGFPFIKIQTLRDNISGVDRSNWLNDVEMAPELRQAIIDRLASPVETKRKTTIVRPGR